MESINPDGSTTTLALPPSISEMRFLELQKCETELAHTQSALRTLMGLYQNTMPLSVIEENKDEALKDLHQQLNAFWKQVKELTQEPLADNAVAMTFSANGRTAPREASEDEKYGLIQSYQHQNEPLPACLNSDYSNTTPEP